MKKRNIYKGLRSNNNIEVPAMPMNKITIDKPVTVFFWIVGGILLLGGLGVIAQTIVSDTSITIGGKEVATTDQVGGLNYFYFENSTSTYKNCGQPQETFVDYGIVLNTTSNSNPLVLSVNVTGSGSSSSNTYWQVCLVDSTSAQYCTPQAHFGTASSSQTAKIAVTGATGNAYHLITLCSAGADYGLTISSVNATVTYLM